MYKICLHKMATYGKFLLTSILREKKCLIKVLYSLNETNLKIYQSYMGFLNKYYFRIRLQYFYPV